MDEKIQKQGAAGLHKKFEFRDILPEEAEQAAEIERICFPPNEACTREMMIRRVEKAPDLFLVAVDKESGKAAGFLNGLATNEQKFRDEFFTDAGLHDPKGDNIMLLGLDVLPEYQHRGIASALMRHMIRDAKEKGRKGLILTCKERLIGFYESFGYRNLGRSRSEHGGAVWYDMLLELPAEVIPGEES